MKKNTELKELVKQRYSELALNSNSSELSCCCGTNPSTSFKKEYTIMSEDYSHLKGYVSDADLGVGCGLPTQYARIKKGDTVIDLGSGAGNDCFVVVAETGETGKVIGIDFSPQMIAKARENSNKRGYTNVKFIEGDIENIPLDDNTADVVISNCVLNLLPQKDKIFKEIFRVLKPNGHFCISDVVLNGIFPKKFTESAAMYAGCIASAIQKKDYLREIENANFMDIRIEKTKTISIPDEVLEEHLDKVTIEQYRSNDVGIYSITITGNKKI
jgi:SAM-dependent methyltransferase